MTFDTRDDWLQIYREVRLAAVEVTTGPPFEMMTPAGFLRDGGLANSARVIGQALARVTYLKRMVWLMSKMRHAVPYLGYLALSGTKPV